MSIEDKKSFDRYKIERREYFEEMLISSQSYDRAILTLASAALGLSFALVHLGQIFYLMCILYFSWLFLFFAIIFSLSSFLLIEWHAVTQIEYIGKYYLGDKLEFENKKHWSSYMMVVTKVASGISFLLALLLTAIFIGNNVAHKDSIIQNYLYESHV